MKPKIAIILTPDGIDTVTVLSMRTKARREGYRLCSLLEDEFHKFEQAIKEKLKMLKKGKKPLHGFVEQ